MCVFDRSFCFCSESQTVLFGPKQKRLEPRLLLWQHHDTNNWLCIYVFIYLCVICYTIVCLSVSITFTHSFQRYSRFCDLALFPTILLLSLSSSLSLSFASLLNNASVSSSGAQRPPPPLPLGISRTFAHVFILEVGHLKFYHCLGVGHLPIPETTPGVLTALSGFSLARKIWFSKLSKMTAFVNFFRVYGRLLNADHAFSVLR